MDPEQGFLMITPSTLKASAERNIAPKFCGSSISSQIKINGSSFFSFAKAKMSSNSLYVTGETNAISTGFMINSSIDYNFIAVPFENGMLVTSGNLNLGKESYNAEMSLIDKGNLIDTFVKDEVIENDAEIEAIYKEIISSKENEPVTKLVLAPLNYGLYLAKEGKVAESEKLWRGIDVSKLPSETDKDKNSIESLKTIFDRDIPDLLTILKNY